MIEKEKLVSNMEKDIAQLESLIDNYKFYNLKSRFIQKLINSGIFLEEALPFILSSIIIYSTQTAFGNRPFHTDTVFDPIHVEEVDTSLGYHEELTSYDKKYDNNKIEYTTGWYKNDIGLYEKNTYVFELDKEIDDIDNVLNKSEKELKEMFTNTDVNTIQKEKLNDEDLLFLEPCVIVTRSYNDNDNALERDETTTENINHSIMYLALMCLLGFGFDKVKKYYVKSVIKDRLNQIKVNYTIIDDLELDKLRKIIEIKRSNLDLLTNDNKVYSYTLRN